jgi:eukaryotic-like serine/threonine-protein kinase
MLCLTCKSPLEPNARFCGVCGHRLDRAPSPVAGPVSPSVGSGPKIQVASSLGAVHSAAAKQRSSDPFIGQVLNNRFRIESKIGEGGFGAVYRGTQTATGRKVALKLLHPEMTADDNLVARFRREGLVLCNLRDAHTITTYDFDQTPDGTLYIAMELLEGKSLHEVFHANPPLAWRRVCKILIAMCSSLAEAHGQGIVHRDLKPENIYLETRGGHPDFVKILDFGIAKVMRGDALDPQSQQLTATGQTLGTLEYMSPEQLMGKALDGRSDVYALGVLGYEMMTGRLPFPDAKGPAGLITAQLKQTPAPPSKANAQLPPGVDRILLRCLEKDIAKRFADVSALASALADLLQSESSMPVSMPLSDAQHARPAGQSRPPGYVSATGAGSGPSFPSAGRAALPSTPPMAGPQYGANSWNDASGSPPVPHVSTLIGLGNGAPPPSGGAPVGRGAVSAGSAGMTPSLSPGAIGSAPPQMSYPQVAKPQIASSQHSQSMPRRRASWLLIGVILLAVGALFGGLLALLVH